MGSNRFYREERPARRESVGGFWIDPRPVTNADFARVRARDRLPHHLGTRARSRHLSGRRSLAAGAGLGGLYQTSAAPSACAITRRGGPTSPAPTGGIPKVPAAASMTGPITRSFTSPLKTSRPMRPGPARRCRPKPNGSSRHAAGSTTRPTPGARNSRRMARPWRTPGRGVFPSKISPRTATRALHRSARSRPIRSASTT